jgi:hypothetical protein
MNFQIARRDDGAIAVVSHMENGYAYGYLMDSDGSKTEFLPPIISLLDRGSWDVLPDFGLVVLAPPLSPVNSSSILEKKMTQSEAGRIAARARWGQVRSPKSANNLEILKNGGSVTIDAKEFPDLMEQMAKQRVGADLSKVHIKDYPMFQGNLGLTRAQMPQIPHSQMGKFIGHIQAKGIPVKPESVNPKILKPIQAEVLGSRSGKILEQMRSGSFHETPSKGIVVSQDGYILDGHHRWAAAVARSIEQPEFKLQINRVDLPMKELLIEANAFNEREGIESRTLKKFRLRLARILRLPLNT